jgi:hypothetical protein
MTREFTTLRKEFILWINLQGPRSLFKSVCVWGGGDRIARELFQAYRLYFIRQFFIIHRKVGGGHAPSPIPRSLI